jgi:hypothetical protein
MDQPVEDGRLRTNCYCHRLRPPNKAYSDGIAKQ